jgi:hypothetical protein
MARTWVFATGIVLSAGMVVAAAEDLEVAVTVKEPVGVARQAEPVSGGVPFKKGQVGRVSDLALCLKSGRVVPAQFTKLAGYEDGSVQWALVDFRAAVPANGTAEFVVRKGATPAWAGVRVSETAETVTVNTGVLDFTVSKTKFNLLESVKVNGAAATRAPIAKAVRVVALEGGEFAAGAPEKVTWEYKGPERITLRVDGAYLNEKGQTFLSYTTRLTAWAGSSVLRIDHAVRNSDPKQAGDAKIKEATLSVPLAFTAEEQGKGYDWVAGGDGRVGVLVVNRNSGGCFPGESTYTRRPTEACYKQSLTEGRLEVALIPPADDAPDTKARKSILYGYDKAGGFFALADCAHKNSQITLDFYTGRREAAANAVREQALRTPLHALADPGWISETESIGSGHFGALADEIATYKTWGWKKWDDPAKQPRAPAEPRAYVAKEGIHYVSEADSVEALTLMYIRTAERGFLDWARAWAEYGVTHYTYRTDGFTFSTARIPNSQVSWGSPRKYGWGDSRSEWCHYYAAGLFDYYCLTGEVGVLEGARDLVEQAVAWSARRSRGSAIGYYGVRDFGREWLGILRQAQFTRDPVDRKVADGLAEVAFTCSDWDPRGFVRWGGADYVVRLWLKPAMQHPRLQAYLTEKGIAVSEKGVVTDKNGASWTVCSDGGTWEQCSLQMAFERYYRLSGSQEAKARAVQMAKFGRDCQISKKCQQAFYYTVMDFPEKGQVFDIADWDDAHKNCPGPGAQHHGHYTLFFPDVFARAYSLTGDKEWLDAAQRAWNRGSKRGVRGETTTEQQAPDDEVFVFAQYLSSAEESALSTCRMFYEVPRAR